MIKATGIKKEFKSGGDTISVLNGIDLSIEAGEFVAIMGPSGAGKSTFLYQLGLLDRPTSGSIVINGVATENLSHGQRTKFRLDNLGFVFQDYALLPELTAAENIYITLLMKGESRKTAFQKACDVLAEVGLDHRVGNLPSQLSGGEQQRVSLARAVVHNPAILYADEPTASLDSERSTEIMGLFKKLNGKGQTIVMVTHEPEYAVYAKRLVQIKDGQILSDERQKGV